jgi:hypothetical protein
MRVKIGETWYDPNNIPIMIELTDADKINIANMLPEAKRYSAYPDGVFESDQEALDWMEADKKLKEWKAYNE